MNWRSLPGILPLRNALEILVGLFARGWVAVCKTNNIVVLAYHSISDSPWIHAVSKEAFTEQTEFLRRCMIPISLAEAERQYTQGILSTKRPKVVITFDDGYEDWVTNAMPALLAQGLPATFFVTTSFKIITSETHPGLIPMAPAHVSTLAQAGFDIGSHSHTHADLAHCPEEQFMQELTESKRLLREFSHQEIGHLSYPKGRYTPSRFPLITKAGYTVALAGHGPFGRQSPLLAAPRLPVTKNLSSRRLQARIYRLAAWGF